MHYLFAIVLVASCVAFSHVDAASADLSSSEAEKLLNKVFTEGAERKYGFSYGTYQVYHMRENDYAKGIMSDKLLPELEYLNKLGLLDVRISGRHPVNLPVQQHVGTVHVGQTQKGRAFTDNNGVFWLPTGRHRVAEIVSTEPIKLGSNQCSLVLEVCDSSWTPEYKLITKELDRINLPDRQNCKFLYKYDPFKRAWVNVAGDCAEVGGQFRTNNVDSYMMSGGRLN